MDGEVDVKQASVLAFDTTRDLAILKVPGLRPDRAPLKFAMPHADRPPTGLRIFTSGFPGASNVTAQGHVRVPTRNAGVVSVVFDGGVKAFGTDAAIGAGMSGGPVTDLCGRVVGINVSGVTVLRELAIGSLGFDKAIRGIEAMDFLSSHGQTYAVDRKICRAATPGSNAPFLIAVAAAVLLLTTAIWMMWQRLTALAARQPGVGASRVLRDEISRYIRDHGPKDRLSPAGPLARRRRIVGQNAAAGLEARLREGVPLVIGRSDSANLLVSQSSVSREHCRVLLENGRVWIEDLGSAGGTFLLRVSMSRDGSTDTGAQYTRLSRNQRIELGADGYSYRFRLAEPSIEFEIR
jgi:hypothetical protein